MIPPGCTTSEPVSTVSHQSCPRALPHTGAVNQQVVGLGVLFTSQLFRSRNPTLTTYYFYNPYIPRRTHGVSNLLSNFQKYFYTNRIEQPIGPAGPSLLACQLFRFELGLNESESRVMVWFELRLCSVQRCLVVQHSLDRSSPGWVPLNVSKPDVSGFSKSGQRYGI